MIWAILAKGSSGWRYFKAEPPCNKGEINIPLHWLHISIGWQKGEEEWKDA